MRCLLVFMLFGAFARASEIGKVCDRNGVVLMEVERGSDGKVTKRYPFKALAAHLLYGLNVLPEGGETIYLTIDSRVQMAAERTLRVVSRGCAVVVDPKSGDVLAMASVPSFDPGAFDEAALRADETEPLLNRAASAYCPGATFLPVTALAGLRQGLRDFSNDCTGLFPIGNKVMKCWIADKGSSHGVQKLPEALKNSCGPFFFAYGIAAGPEAIISTAEVYGLGKLSGLPLREEATGLVSVKKYLAEASPNETWSDGYTANTAIGQGMVLVTPLQMASFAANLAKGGDLKKLRLVERIVRRDGSVSREEPAVLATVEDSGLQESDLETVREAMRTSVAPGGNAQKGAIPGFKVGARTGVSQFWRNGKRDNQTWFVGFAASAKEDYVFCVMVQGAKSGGGVAAPLAARIISSALKEEAAPLEAAAGSFDRVDQLPHER
jgi:penicillin-binding protein 2